MGRRLDADEIIATTETLQKRILERFPDSNLGNFSGEVVSVARKAMVRTEWIRKPLLPLRIVVGLFMFSFVSLVVLALHEVRGEAGAATLGELLQSIEAALSSAVFVGVATVFLVTLEHRVKRRRALHALHELRGMAHIVDMHQLTKDPKDPRFGETDTPSSPKRTMDPFELSRYLDYCSELLALINKIGALYVYDLDDQVVLTAGSGLDRLIDSLSQKIWQKMTLVDRIMASIPPKRPAEVD